MLRAPPFGGHEFHSAMHDRERESKEWDRRLLDQNGAKPKAVKTGLQLASEHFVPCARMRVCMGTLNLREKVEEGVDTLA